MGKEIQGYNFTQKAPVIQDILNRAAALPEPTELTEKLERIEHAALQTIAITYEALNTLRDGGALTPGQAYRITDYVTMVTATSPSTRSAGHPFDIIVTALDATNLSEDAWAIQHDGDEYFKDARLEAWKIKYCLDNDTVRFTWADAEGGKGVIYEMEDEWGNRCPYDFKNIQYKRWKAAIKDHEEDPVLPTGIAGAYYAQYPARTGDLVVATDEEDFIWAFTFSSDDKATAQTDVSLTAYVGTVENEGTVGTLPNIVTYASQYVEFRGGSNCTVRGSNIYAHISGSVWAADVRHIYINEGHQVAVCQGGRYMNIDMARQVLIGRSSSRLRLSRCNRVTLGTDNQESVLEECQDVTVAAVSQSVLAMCDRVSSAHRLSSSSLWNAIKLTVKGDAFVAGLSTTGYTYGLTLAPLNADQERIAHVEVMSGTYDAQEEILIPYDETTDTTYLVRPQNTQEITAGNTK